MLCFRSVHRLEKLSANVLNNKFLFSYFEQYLPVHIMSTFVQHRNAIKGTTEWIVQDENYDFHQEIARSGFADMLHDTERNEMYEKALKQAINVMHKRGKKANVLDIGTGTGLLAMMAARHGADSVVACEVFKPICDCARQVVALNGFEGKIKIIEKKSTDLTVGKDCDLETKCNILVTEVFDTELIGEGALNTFKHAHESLLESDCIVVPHAAYIYVEIIDSPLLYAWNRYKNIYDENGDILLTIPDKIKTCKSIFRNGMSFQDLQLSALPLQYVNSLVSPQQIFKFDFSGTTNVEFDRENVISLICKTAGRAQGLFFWWDLQMDPESQNILSCAPNWTRSIINKSELSTVPWRDHWLQAIYFFPNEIDVVKGETVYLLSAHDEYSFTFDLVKELRSNDLDKFEEANCDCQLHFSRTRMGQLNDNTRTKKYLSLMESIIQSDSIVLIIGNGFYIGLAACKYGAKKVFFYEQEITCREFIQNFIDSNNLSNVLLISDLKDISLNGERINIILSEPYFISSILPWDNLHILHILKECRPFLSDDVRIFPRKAVIKGMVMDFDNLHRICWKLDECQGFKMKPFDDLIESSSNISDEEIEPQPLWEYPGKSCSEIVEIAEINLLPEGGVLENHGEIHVSDKAKRYNGISLWVDWIYGNDRSPKNTITTGPIIPPEICEYITWDMHTRQGVFLLREHSERKSIPFRFKFDISKDDLSLKLFR